MALERTAASVEPESTEFVDMRRRFLSSLAPTVAVLVLGLNLAAYSAEVYRAGIQSLERGQIEASRSLGLTYFQSMRYVIVPQVMTSS